MFRAPGPRLLQIPANLLGSFQDARAVTLHQIGGDKK